MLAYRADEVPVGDDQRQHVELMREIARRFNERFGEILVVPELPDPGGRRPDHGPPGARPARCRRPAAAKPGTVSCSTSPKTITQEDQERGHRLRLARCGAARTRPGITNLIEILAVARGVEPRRRSSASSRAPATATSRRRSPRRWSSCLAPVRERYAELRPDEAALEAVARGGRREGPGDGLRDARRRALGHRHRAYVGLSRRE